MSFRGSDTVMNINSRLPRGSCKYNEGSKEKLASCGGKLHVIVLVLNVNKIGSTCYFLYQTFKSF